jgi:hypothetical protein
MACCGMLNSISFGHQMRTTKFFLQKMLYRIAQDGTYHRGRLVLLKICAYEQMS